MNDGYLESQLARLRELREGMLYYTITMIGDDEGEIIWSTMSHFAGWCDKDCRYEMRQARHVYGAFAETFWGAFGQPYIVINDAEELPVFFAAGGNALIADDVAKEHMAEFLEPDPSALDLNGGFRSLESCHPTALKRVPNPKLRMLVIKRDNHRCRICGRRPDDHIDVELHVHHIKPWASGGLTEPENLITLCHTCHNGLNPHEDTALFKYTAPHLLSKSSQRALDELIQGVIKYRKIIYGMALQAE